MKKIITGTAAFFLALVFFLPQQLEAQTPEKMSYQAIVRDASDSPIISSAIGMQISILQGSASGTAVYVETQTPMTNANGLISIEIGNGSVQSGTFAAIDWANGPYFIKTETDPAGGTTYSITGTSQLLSVPYALNAKTVSGTSVSITGDTLYVSTGNWVIVPGISAANLPIGSITALDCQNSTDNGSLSGDSSANGVSSSIPYTGGNNGSHSGQSVSSTGVTGLTATLTAGVFANGSGSLTYNITGTPSSNGTASFALNIGGQTCTLTRLVAPDYPAGSIFCGSGPTEVVDVTNPVTGRTWMDRDLGASRRAMTAMDANSYGGLYQWGRAADGHQCRNSSISYSQSTTDQVGHGDFIVPDLIFYIGADWRDPNNDNLWQGVNGINNPCPAGYRIPTEAEFTAEIATWTSLDSAGSMNSVLKLPLGGIRNKDNNGAIELVGLYGQYWTSTINLPTFSARFFYHGNVATHWDSHRAFGQSVRCIKD